jgi:hypothetical protein
MRVLHDLAPSPPRPPQSKASDNFNANASANTSFDASTNTNTSVQSWPSFPVKQSSTSNSGLNQSLDATNIWLAQDKRLKGPPISKLCADIITPGKVSNNPWKTADKKQSRSQSFVTRSLPAKGQQSPRSQSFSDKTPRKWASATQSSMNRSLDLERGLSNSNESLVSNRRLSFSPPEKEQLKARGERLPDTKTIKLPFKPLAPSQVPGLAPSNDWAVSTTKLHNLKQSDSDHSEPSYFARNELKETESNESSELKGEKPASAFPIDTKAKQHRGNTTPQNTTPAKLSPFPEVSPDSLTGRAEMAVANRFTRAARTTNGETNSSVKHSTISTDRYTTSPEGLYVASTPRRAEIWGEGLLKEDLLSFECSPIENDASFIAVESPLSATIALRERVNAAATLPLVSSRPIPTSPLRQERILPKFITPERRSHGVSPSFEYTPRTNNHSFSSHNDDDDAYEYFGESKDVLAPLKKIALDKKQKNVMDDSSEGSTSNLRSTHMPMYDDKGDDIFDGLDQTPSVESFNEKRVLSESTDSFASDPSTEVASNTKLISGLVSKGIIATDSSHEPPIPGGANSSFDKNPAEEAAKMTVKQFRSSPPTLKKPTKDSPSRRSKQSLAQVKCLGEDFSNYSIDSNNSLTVIKPLFSVPSHDVTKHENTSFEEQRTYFSDESSSTSTGSSCEETLDSTTEEIGNYYSNVKQEIDNSLANAFFDFLGIEWKVDESFESSGGSELVKAAPNQSQSTISAEQIKRDLQPRTSNATISSQANPSIFSLALTDLMKVITCNDGTLETKNPEITLRDEFGIPMVTDTRMVAEPIEHDDLGADKLVFDAAFFNDIWISIQKKTEEATGTDTSSWSLPFCGAPVAETHMTPVVKTPTNKNSSSSEYHILNAILPTGAGEEAKEKAAKVLGQCREQFPVLYQRLVTSLSSQQSRGTVKKTQQNQAVLPTAQESEKLLQGNDADCGALATTGSPAPKLMKVLRGTKMLSSNTSDMSTGSDILSMAPSLLFQKACTESSPPLNNHRFCSGYAPTLADDNAHPANKAFQHSKICLPAVEWPQCHDKTNWESFNASYFESSDLVATVTQDNITKAPPKLKPARVDVKLGIKARNSLQHPSNVAETKEHPSPDSVLDVPKMEVKDLYPPSKLDFEEFTVNESHCLSLKTLCER